MKRIYRELSNDVKKKISDSMKDYHKNLTFDERQKINMKQSESQKRYWSTIGSKNDDGE